VAYRRDLIGHFIRSNQREQRPCTHACCRGYRVHPDNYPTVLPSRTLRRASDQDLAAHFNKVTREDTPQARYAEDQILYEMERRDREAQLRRDRAEGRAAARAARRMEIEAETERIFLEAEAYTRGNWTNLKGTARGITDREILLGRQDVFARYASEEAREYFTRHPRPTAAYFRERDTRMDYRVADVKRMRRRGA
jgi:prophage tail gpP-like protein